MSWRHWTVVVVVAYVLTALWLESRRIRRLRERQRWIDEAFDEVDTANTDKTERNDV
jgi:uncharacterized membrane protein YcjF (UPF0283 family)